MSLYFVAALYKFVSLPDFAELQPDLLAYCADRQITGTIVLAAEGINGTIAGTPEQVRAVLDYLRRDARFADLSAKESLTEQQPFPRLKVRLKPEIITMGIPDLDPARNAGQYVKPEDWNRLLNDPAVVVIDTRNDYEVSIGTFQGAVNPQIQSFSELPGWLMQATDLEWGTLRGKPKVAMFCTGGIRCEKSTAFLRHQGFAEVYHLEGGILKYLETIPASESLWEGECFVFDQRVSVVHGVKPGNYELCHACGYPISTEDRASPLFVPNISCPNCYGQKTPEQLQGLMERKRQLELAHQRHQVQGSA